MFKTEGGDLVIQFKPIKTQRKSDTVCRST
jgi:hypothetical protein